jgi:hypothetical protein
MINNIYIILIILVVLIIYLYKRYDTNCKDTFQDTETIDSVDYIESVKEKLERELEQTDLECSSDFVKVVGYNDLDINDIIADLEYKIEVIDKKIFENKSERTKKETELRDKFDNYMKYFTKFESMDSDFFKRQIDFRRDNNITQVEILDFLNKYTDSTLELTPISATNIISSIGNFDNSKIETENNNLPESKKNLILNLLLLNKLNVLINKDEIDFSKIKETSTTIQYEDNTQIHKKYFSMITKQYNSNDYTNYPKKTDIDTLYSNITSNHSNLTDKTDPAYKEYVSTIKNEIDNIIYGELGYNKVRGVKISETDDCKTKSKHRVLTNRLKILNDRLYELNEEIGNIDNPDSEMYNSKANIEENIKALNNQDYRLYEDYTRHFYDISKENNFIKEDIFKKTELSEHFGSTTEEKPTIENKYLFKKMMILPYQYKYFNHVYFIIKKEVILNLIDLKKMLFKLGLVMDLSLNKSFELFEENIKKTIIEHIKTNETNYELMHDTQIKKEIHNNINIFLEKIKEKDFNFNISKIKEKINEYFIFKGKIHHIKIIYILEFYFNPRNDMNIDLIKYELYIPLKKEEPSYLDLYPGSDTDIYSSLKEHPNQFGLKLQIKNVLKKNEFYQNHILTKDIYELLENEFNFREGSIFYLMLNRKDLNRTNILVNFANNLEKYKLEDLEQNNFYVLYDHNAKSLFSVTD